MQQRECNRYPLAIFAHGVAETEDFNRWLLAWFNATVKNHVKNLPQIDEIVPQWAFCGHFAGGKRGTNMLTARAFHKENQWLDVVEGAVKAPESREGAGKRLAASRRSGGLGGR